jgi:outer membrane protein
MKKLLLGLVLFIGFGAAAQSKVAHVDSQKLLDTMPSRKATMAQLEEIQKSGFAELEEMQKSFESAYKIFIEKDKAGEMPPMIKENEQNKLMRMQQNLETRQTELEQELKSYSEQLNQPILDRVQKAIELVAERKKLSYVLDQSSMTMYYKGGMDITNEVITELLILDAAASKK